MRVSKKLIWANIAALSLNAIMLVLMTIEKFPPVLGLILLVVFLGASVLLSCWAQGKLPKKKRPLGFHLAPTERMETL